MEALQALERGEGHALYKVLSCWHISPKCITVLFHLHCATLTAKVDGKVKRCSAVRTCCHTAAQIVAHMAAHTVTHIAADTVAHIAAHMHLTLLLT